MIISYMDLGIQQKNLAKYDEAIKNFHKAEQIIKRNYGSEDARLAVPYANMGNIYMSKGDYSKALEYHESALRNFGKDSVRFRNRIKGIEFNLAGTLVQLKRYEDAIDICNKNIMGDDESLKPYYYDLMATILIEKKILLV